MSSLDLLLAQIDDPSDLSWKDETYDLALARDVTGEDRTTLISRLIDAARADDPRAVLTLGYIGADETLPALIALGQASNPMAATARRAVVLLGHGKEVLDLIINDALHSAAKMERIAAVMDLTKIGGSKVIEPLVQTLEDSEFEIRELAWQGLVVCLGFHAAIRGPDGKTGLMTHIELLSVWIGSSFETLKKMGVDGMRELVKKRLGAATPESLGAKFIANPAPETFQAIRLALFDADAQFPVDAIKQLTGSPRQWAETMILLRLQSHDLRVPAAMMRLGAEWTVPVLEEVATAAGTPAELRDALLESVRSLRAS